MEETISAFLFINTAITYYYYYKILILERCGAVQVRSLS